MRLQLTAALLVLALAAPARAEVEAASHVLIFTEHSKANQGVKVLHPSTDVAATHGPLGINAGYEMDVVSGATARVYGGAGDHPDAVSGATFSDTRQAARGGVSFETASVGLSAGYSYGWEHDYRSHSLTVAARGDFLERNFTLALAYTRNWDRVCDRNNGHAQSPLDLQPLDNSDHCFRADAPEIVTRQLAIDTFEPSLGWTVTPKLQIEVGGTLQILDGFQSNPYRQVRIGPQGHTPQERLPSYRQRYALFARAHQGIPIARSAVHFGARVYRDSWDVHAVSADAEWLTYIGSAVLFGVRGRFHQQTGAIFFRTAGDYRIKGPTGRYWTGDRELAPLENLSGGGKLAWIKRRQQQEHAFIEELEVDVRFDGLFYRPDPNAPNADRRAAYLTQLGLTLRF
jgi:hypothetical protein